LSLSSERTAFASAKENRSLVVLREIPPDMGADLGVVWVHAMETPREQQYYFKPAELLALKLATAADSPKPVATKS